MKGFQFRKSFQLLPGVRLNISKTGMSVSLGPKGAHITTGNRGTHLFLDLPGSGAYYRKKLDAKSEKKTDDKPKEDEPGQGDELPEKLDVGFLGRLTVPGDELALVEALKALVQGDEDRALEQARHVIHLADGAFLAGFLLLKRGEFDTAAAAFNQALKSADQLGKHADKYELQFEVEMPITDEVFAHVKPSAEGVLLALAECHQRLGLTELAIENLQTLHRSDPDDLVIRLSLAEALNDAYPEAEQSQKEIVALAEDVHNASPIHAGLMYYRARALRKLGLVEGAKHTLTKALRRKKDYPAELLRALHYERALIYELTGEAKKAHGEYQKIYAESPTYEDVAARLGL